MINLVYKLKLSIFFRKAILSLGTSLTILHKLVIGYWLLRSNLKKHLYRKVLLKINLLPCSLIHSRRILNVMLSRISEYFCCMVLCVFLLCFNVLNKIITFSKGEKNVLHD